MAASGTWRQTVGGYRAQIVENCSFFSARDAHIGVILTREPLGNFKAVVTRAEKHGRREALLSSESAETVQKAYELLLVKSADAVQNYISANGFEFAPWSKKIGDVVDDDDDGASSVSSASEVMTGDLDKDLGDSILSFDAESAYESMTEDEGCAGYDRARGSHTSRNSRMYPKWQAQAKHAVNNVNFNGHNSAGPSHAPSPPVSLGHNTHPQAPPPSAPSQSSSASCTPTLAAGPNKPPAMGQPPGQQPPPAAAQAQFPAAIDYRLCIKSRVPATGDISEQRMVVRTLPTRAHVRAAALRYVEYNPSLFRHVVGAPPPFKADGNGNTGIAGPTAVTVDRHLRANVTRVSFGGNGGAGESYDLTTYGEDDLSRLCASVAGGRAGAGELPLFEVVVTNVGPAGSFFTLA
ncbi:hypothetical protein UCDDA912_g06685 [Diaporthe ampelina]|uniref:Uncharacterized protein n=1 Tax=Diaporthe ampelina TaxID=1214573 RepID=A0A0G2HZG5_9PEZI|nr:hypothetical protein UCDDA912_g06685 [Diaporthe ampelina]